MTNDLSAASARRRVLWGGTLAGAGLGGFFDGVVLHQILGWHHMVSSLYPPTTLAALRLNTLGDGLFHAGTYAATLTGLLLLWSVARRRHDAWPAGLLAGLLLFGFGLFNVLEGLVDHHLLGLHHVRPGPHERLYDLGFLAWGALMLGGGAWLVRANLGRVSETAGTIDRSQGVEAREEA